MWQQDGKVSFKGGNNIGIFQTVIYLLLDGATETGWMCKQQDFAKSFANKPLMLPDFTYTPNKWCPAHFNTPSDRIWPLTSRQDLVVPAKKKKKKRPAAPVPPCAQCGTIQVQEQFARPLLSHADPHRDSEKQKRATWEALLFTKARGKIKNASCPDTPTGFASFPPPPPSLQQTNIAEEKLLCSHRSDSQAWKRNFAFIRPGRRISEHKHQ